MTFSKLISGTIPHHGKYSSRGGLLPNRFIDHHWAGLKGGDAHLSDPSVAASVHYIIYADGVIKGQVPEEFRAWTSGSAFADNPSITVELQNTTGNNGLRDDDPGAWLVSDKALQSLIALTADVARRYGWGGVAAHQVRGHFEFYATACPGGFVRSRLGDIRAKADAAYREGSSTKPPVTKPPTGKSISQLADEVLANKHGNGADRAKSLGAKYNAVQQEVNRRLGQLTPPPAPAKVDLERMARATIRGDYGDGAARRKNLGSNYDAVMRIVNNSTW